jgi:hypothetical protein
MRIFTTALSALALLAASTAPLTLAQTEPTTPPSDPCKNPTYRQCPNSLPERTFYLHNVTQQADANETVSALRNLLPAEARVFLVFNQAAIVARAMPDDLAQAQRLLNDLDRPKKTYRLTYTVTEMDGTRKIGTQHFAMVLTRGQDTSLKLGNKFPIVTEAATPPLQTQFTYIDIGMNFDATLTEMGQNAMLKSSVDDTSVAPQKSDIGGVQEPIVRQATLKGESLLTPGKPLMLGSVDIPGSTSHLDVEVVMEPLP